MYCQGSIDDAKLNRILLQQKVHQELVDDERISDRLQVDLTVPFVNYTQNNADSTQHSTSQQGKMPCKLCKYIVTEWHFMFIKIASCARRKINF